MKVLALISIVAATLAVSASASARPSLALSDVSSGPAWSPAPLASFVQASTPPPVVAATSQTSTPADPCNVFLELDGESSWSSSCNGITDPTRHLYVEVKCIGGPNDGLDQPGVAKSDVATWISQHHCTSAQVAGTSSAPPPPPPPCEVTYYQDGTVGAVNCNGVNDPSRTVWWQFKCVGGPNDGTLVPVPPDDVQAFQTSYETSDGCTSLLPPPGDPPTS